MSTKSYHYLKVIHVSRVLVIGLVLILAIIVTTGFIWIPTDEVIAPPELMLLDKLWRVFVCWCPV